VDVVVHYLSWLSLELAELFSDGYDYDLVIAGCWRCHMALLSAVLLYGCM
jgi:hypothetical protein